MYLYQITYRKLYRYQGRPDEWIFNKIYTNDDFSAKFRYNEIKSRTYDYKDVEIVRYVLDEDWREDCGRKREGN